MDDAPPQFNERLVVSMSASRVPHRSHRLKAMDRLQVDRDSNPPVDPVVLLILSPGRVRRRGGAGRGGGRGGLAVSGGVRGCVFVGCESGLIVV
jgi:hypothetical protein